MDLEYDLKFAEMKKYIPFLESMINRLESTTSSTSKNPRQAQLDKIRSLRDLLLDKKKRMKMENLLKCEQVLVNLYAKVEQRDTLPGIKKTSDPLFQSSTVAENPELDVCRNKLKLVSTKIKEEHEHEDTLPEIARACENEVVCTPGSKEPALFQRRPNKASISPSRASSSKSKDKSPQKALSKRNYTRVLVSPEPSPRRWSPANDASSQDKPLFSRRSPRKSSPKRSSPSHKKDKKKSSKTKKSHCTGFNITLNVPEDSLSSLNRRDILERIIECPNDDVDIKTLCDVKAQILRELKQSGSSEDISDLILKSYRVKKKRIKNKKHDIEEGELSDSESEAIQSIYGNLDKHKKDPEHFKSSKDKDTKQRKVQICLVLNTEKDPPSLTTEGPKAIESSDFEMYDDNVIPPAKDQLVCDDSLPGIEPNDVGIEPNDVGIEPNDVGIEPNDVITIDDNDEPVSKDVPNESKEPSSLESNTVDSKTTNSEPDSSEALPVRANFYKPLNDREDCVASKINIPNSDTEKEKDDIKTSEKDCTNKDYNNTQDTPVQEASIKNSETVPLIIEEEIPLLNTEPVVPALSAQKDVVSEIEILQALKNEILSDSIAIPNAETVTPALHQPKLTKVASAQEIKSKKRISIEKYKEKSVSTPKASLFVNNPSRRSIENKKQSLKLTEAECERFNFPSKLALDDSSEEDVELKSPDIDIYGDLDTDRAPKSPENNEENNSASSSPIIIPVDPVKPTIVSSIADVDMRVVPPIISPKAPKPVPPPSSVALSNSNFNNVSMYVKEREPKRPLLMDPRMKRDINKPVSKGSPNVYQKNLEGNQRPLTSFPNMTPNLTPSRSMDMTPSRQNIDMDDGPRRRHVYAPLPGLEHRDSRDDSTPHWELNNIESNSDNPDIRWELWKDMDHNERNNRDEYDRSGKTSKSGNRERDDYSYSRVDGPRTPIHTFGRSDKNPSTPVHPFGRLKCPSTPSHPFGRSEGPMTPIHSLGRSDCPSTPCHPFGRSDAPMTPSHPFGRSDAPMTPSHSFGRSDGPMTPSHPFGRSDGPMTPSHPFGRSDAPMTPSHTFGRSDAPMTPSHPFGRSEPPRTPSHPFGRQDSGSAPMTPNHPFGRSDYTHNTIPKDPRLNRSNDFDSRRYSNDRDRDYNSDRRSHMSNRSYDRSDSYRNHERDNSSGRNDRNSYTRNEPENQYNGDRGGSNNHHREYEKSRYFGRDNTRREYNCASNMGRSERARSLSRAPSVGRSFNNTNNIKTLSVTPQSGRSFTIDTSVNTTFQHFLSEKGLPVLEPSFNSRRDRAASVGRTLTREPNKGRSFREGSVGRNLTQVPRAAQEDTSGYKRMVDFVRARSMGRDVSSKSEKSFNDIKADLKSFKPKEHKYLQQIDTKRKLNYVEPRSRKDKFDMRQKNDYVPPTKTKTSYSPRKNYRDPRMRKEDRDNRHKFSHDDKRKGYGIVYSNDNIAKGAILGPGYGVKNYKIPKIKRPVEEKEDIKNVEEKKTETKDTKSAVEDKKDKGTINKSVYSTENKTQTSNKKMKYDKKSDSKKIDGAGKKKSGNTKTEVEPKKIDKNKKSSSDEKSKSVVDVSKRTKKGKKTDADTTLKKNEETSAKTRKFRRTVIDSDSDPDVSTKEDTSDTIITEPQRNVEDPTQNESTLDSSFGMDDLQSFTENMGSDTVMANISALIADLDNDIDNNKITFADENIELSFEKMLEKIDGPSEVDKPLLLEKTLQKGEELTNDVPTSTVDNKEIATKLDENLKNTEQDVLRKSEMIGDVQVLVNDESNNSKQNSSKDVEDKESYKKMEAINEMDYQKIIKNSDDSCNSKEVTISTTLNEKDTPKLLDELGDDRCSTPDSTIKAVQNRSFDFDSEQPDSTNNKNETNSDVTSTHDLPETSNTSLDDVGSKISDPSDSIGNLLCLLKDKTKIKELLSMLGNQSNENDKIKKALEKISEIVSEEEEKCNDTNAEEPEKTEESLVSDEKNSADNETGDLKDSLDESSEKLTESKPEESTDMKPSSVAQQRTLPGKKIKRGKNKIQNKAKSDGNSNKRITRSEAASMRTEKSKKPSRELKQLHESIKEMFISDDILNATGIRMCRLAKLVDGKAVNQEDDNVLPSEPKPVVVLEKFKEQDIIQETPKVRKKPGPKPKSKPENSGNIENKINDGKPKLVQASKPKTGPKSKTKHQQEDLDPYSFDDSVSETTTHTSEVHTSSDSDSDSLASSKSFGSTEALIELKKKPKRKRRSGWQSGIIKPKRRKKIDSKQTDAKLDNPIPEPEKNITIPDENCHTDKSYCFQKAVSNYSCRLCTFKGFEIVKHYKTEHPHRGIPISRMSDKVAREAIEECADIDFQALRKMSSDKYVCRFCFEEFGVRKKIVEDFFWHVVSMHTGEYKQPCLSCVSKCPFTPDIPPPPKDLKGQLIGYVCGKCNYTQISLENLKSHVIYRHNDEQTAVYTVNLSTMNKISLKTLLKQTNEPKKSRILRSSKSNIEESTISSLEKDSTENVELNSNEITVKSEAAELPAPKITVQSKITFESDDAEIASTNTSTSTVKLEKEDHEISNDENNAQTVNNEFDETNKYPMVAPSDQGNSTDIFDYPHFKVIYSDTRTKEYACCINGKYHYKTALLISMKKHVQIKHSEVWDGYCFICKVIVVPQGEHAFKECFQHYLDKHIDNMPVLEQTEIEDNVGNINEPSQLDPATNAPPLEGTSQKTYINVRPLSALISEEPVKEGPDTLPRIESVMSLGVPSNETRQPSPSLSSQSEDASDSSLFKSPTPVPRPDQQPIETYKYEEVQAEIMSKKHRVVLEEMKTHEKLVHIFKCSGVYCSYTTDSAEAAVLHASTHQRIGGENTLLCTYCDFDCQNNAIELVMHVFKIHGGCQYVCGHCFYRAVGSQLVFPHISRVHGPDAANIILRTDTIAPIAENFANEVLPRDIAVQPFICIDLDNRCKFKTYTHGKFIEHCTKHATAYYLCHICLAVSQTPFELCQHMKVHNYNVYQCTWCVDGGDNENELLAHTSLKHPNKIPQAYMRLTRNNKVLPLIKLNNSRYPSVDIKPAIQTEDPAKSAEKALDLEKMIRSMPHLVAEISKSAPQEPISSTKPLPDSQSNNAAKSTDEESNPATADDVTESEQTENPPSIPLGTTLLASKETLLLESKGATLTPIIKTEPVDESPIKEKASVICLDSDEEEPAEITEPTQNVIDISDDESSSAPTKSIIPFDQLLTCPNCRVVLKSAGGFKAHIMSCLQMLHFLTCFHCPFTTTALLTLYQHYVRDHGGIERGKDLRAKTIHMCAICKYRGKNFAEVKNHVQNIHDLHNVFITRKNEQNEVITYVNGVEKKRKPLPKRKLSGSNTAAPENTTKRMRYGPKDLDKLPQKPILDELTYCSECEFSTKVRLNLLRHFQQHAETQMVPQTAPVNPVPHLETNEKHFDKMINLASSSLEKARLDKQDRSTTVIAYLPPDAAARYPVYVPDRQRNTCGAKGCSYTSVDETMLKCHWETLHSGSNEFICVHCPPSQHWDSSKPFTTARMLTHLKMHDTCLYACSSCPYYHFKKQVLEKHFSEVHKGSAQMMVVREQGSSLVAASAPQATVTAPTMDLKPWKCGLCDYKSMLLPEVVDHCFKQHNTKMQFKCPACPFRTSTLENVTKHKSKSHPDNKEDVFYYYYREGTIPDSPDGTPRWVTQRAKMGIQATEVKTEDEVITPAPTTPLLPEVNRLDLAIVKKEVDELDAEVLYKKFGALCDPEATKYKCPLCSLKDDSRDIMQSHLYEELQYRKWGCKVCSYKAFHKTGLNEHMATEHKQHRLTEPIELPVDTQVEKWVANVLNHQKSIIDAAETSVPKQVAPSTATISKVQENRSSLDQEKSKTTDKQNCTVRTNSTDEEYLKNTFGDFGAAINNKFCCPKCNLQVTAENNMKLHLECELDKLRWRCSRCSKAFQIYHEAQLHSKLCRVEGGSSQPQPMPRDAAVREAWITQLLQFQKQSIRVTTKPTPEASLPNTAEDPLLAIRYEEDVPTPEVEMIARNKRPPPVASTSSPDSDDERLVIDEHTGESESPNLIKCLYCNFTTKYTTTIESHLLRHYNLRQYQCCYCQATFSKCSVETHFRGYHPGQPERFQRTKVPSGPPILIDLPKRAKVFPHTNNALQLISKFKESEVKAVEVAPTDDRPKVVCLVCEKQVLESEKDFHLHNRPVYFSRKGEQVLKCSSCLELVLDVDKLNEHFKHSHPSSTPQYDIYRLSFDTREIHICGHCNKQFPFYKNLKLHHNFKHSLLPQKHVSKPYTLEPENLPLDAPSRVDILALPSPAKLVARKSTTKLPKQLVARKSTTKLPFYENLDYETEYSFYGQRSTSHNLDNITAYVPICNTIRPLNIKMVSEIMDIDPEVVVQDCKKT